MFIPPLMTLLRPVEATPFFQSGNELNSGWFTALGPSALYVSSINKTLVSWFAVGASGNKNAHVAAYDHAAKTWSERVVAGNFLLADDDHGQLALCRDADGYIYAFYGSHSTTQPWSISTAPDDISSWTQQPPLTGSVTYPHPVVIGGVIYLFLRNSVSFLPTVAPMSVRTATPVAGVATFSAQTNIIHFGSDSRVYTSETYAIGSDVHFACTRADGDDTARKGVYYFVYKTATGALENHDGSVSTASGSLPVDTATANASYRLFDHGSGQGEVPSLCFDTAGDPHILFADNGGSGSTYTLKHIKRTAGVWSSPVNVASLTDHVPGTTIGTGFVSTFTAVAGAAGTVEAWYINAAGDKLRRVRSASGVWSAVETVLAAGTYKLLGNSAVRDGAADLRVVFCENSPSSADSGAIAAKRYAHGDSGLLQAAINSSLQDAHYASVAILAGFNHRDGTARLINEADATAFVATFNGNAQIDTAQAKFGTASLLLDGTGDYVTFPDNALLKVTNGDFTIECWVRRNAGKLQTIASKRPDAGSSEYAFYIDASNRLLMQAFSTTVAVVNVTGTTALSAGVWYHVALSRQGATWRMFLDGALEGSATESTSPTASTALFKIGRSESVNVARDFNGWIDEFRFTAGVARYTAAFTPPSAAFPRR